MFAPDTFAQELWLDKNIYEILSSKQTDLRSIEISLPRSVQDTPNKVILFVRKTDRFKQPHHYVRGNVRNRQKDRVSGHCLRTQLCPGNDYVRRCQRRQFRVANPSLHPRSSLNIQCRILQFDATYLQI